MNIRIFWPLFPLLMPVSVFASTVIYTDTSHPPRNADQRVRVVYLDGAEQLQAQRFGQLSADPPRAVKQARQILQSPLWHQQEQHISQAYQGLLNAWTLGLEKFPAVVFDDNYVVYGTSDMKQAWLLWDTYQQENPP
ncbi:TIGR03757 family integrating conjugative element protein [Photorhabdus tasmaniensis]|uniref:TIGR03757 family integrating conjugative element protein n=1 Tax=Photorhabdus tasmaniensis TaxID=1004159 RepID=UPI0040418D1C